jgi:hypothetical protein
MIIQSSTIQMAGSSSLYQEHVKEESLKSWTGSERPDFEGRKLPSGLLSEIQKDMLELSDQAQAMQARGMETSGAARTDETCAFEISDQDKQKILLVQKMLEALTGKKIKFFMMDRLNLKSGNSEINNQAAANGASVQQRQGWGIEYNLHESYYEQEKMSFAAQGMVRTADGREINLSVQLNMSREFASQLDINIRAGDAAIAIDPLVINFNGSAPELTDIKYSFDLDSDGQEDQISFVGPDSGFLALDINEDGQINSGSELFGPGSGDGFAELAQYDADGNGWIDEADSIYSRLRIWTKDADGNDELFALGQKGIGAIFLGSVSTAFDMKDAGNNSLGQVRESGIYLNENGSAGTVQHIDLTI